MKQIKVTIARQEISLTVPSELSEGQAFTLLNIIFNAYSDSFRDKNGNIDIGMPWSWAVWECGEIPFPENASRRSVSGWVGSLKKAGFVHVADSGTEDAAICLTDEGLKLIDAYFDGWCDKIAETKRAAELKRREQDADEFIEKLQKEIVELKKEKAIKDSLAAIHEKAMLEQRKEKRSERMQNLRQELAQLEQEEKDDENREWQLEARARIKAQDPEGYEAAQAAEVAALKEESKEVEKERKLFIWS